MSHDVFISYSSKDKPVGDGLCATLEAQGVRCWIAPRDISPGVEWGEAIIKALDNARLMVLVFSTNANDSPQVRREVERAVHKGIAIIPFRIENVMPAKALEYFLSAPHWLDALTPPLEEHFKRLTTAVRKLLDEAQLSEGSHSEIHRPLPRIKGNAQRVRYPLIAALVLMVVGAAIAAWRVSVLNHERTAAPSSQPASNIASTLPPKKPDSERVIELLNKSLAIQEKSQPQDEHPVVDLALPIELQIQLFPEDTVRIPGLSGELTEVWFGDHWEPFKPGYDYLVWGIPGQAVSPQFRGDGRVKLEITYTRYRDKRRDIRGTNAFPHDPHYQAFAMLDSSEKSTAIAQKLRIKSARAAARCQNCHAHSLKAFGLLDTFPLLERAESCTRCHLAIEPDLVASGHPQLTFELNFFSTNEPGRAVYPDCHWPEPDDASAAGIWAAGQLAELHDSMTQLQYYASYYPHPNQDALRQLVPAYYQALAHYTVLRTLFDTHAIESPDISQIDADVKALQASMNNMDAFGKAALAAADHCKAPGLRGAVANFKKPDAATVKKIVAAIAKSELGKNYLMDGAEQQVYAIFALAKTPGLEDVKVIIDPTCPTKAGEPPVPIDLSKALEKVRSIVGN